MTTLINLVRPVSDRQGESQMVVWRGRQKDHTLFIVLAIASELRPQTLSEAPSRAGYGGVPIRTMGGMTFIIRSTMTSGRSFGTCGRSIAAFWILSVDRNSPLNRRLHPNDVIEAVGRTAGSKPRMKTEPAGSEDLS
jgi:hypothetical protein